MCAKKVLTQPKILNRIEDNKRKVLQAWRKNAKREIEKAIRETKLNKFP